MKTLSKLAWLSAALGATTLALVACDDLIATDIGPFSFDGGLNGFEASIPQTSVPDGTTPNPTDPPTGTDAARVDPVDSGNVTRSDGGTDPTDAGVVVDAGSVKDADNADACVDAAVVNDGMGQMKVVCLDVVNL